MNKQAGNLRFFLLLASKAVKHLHYKVWSRLRGTVFLKYSNFIFFVFGIGTRFSRSDEKNAKFMALTSDNLLKQYFSHETQAVYAYSNGLSFRASQIADDYLLNNISFQDGDKIIDCGANVGDLSLYFKTISASVNIIAFEPSKLECQCAELNLINHSVYNYGLWSEDTTLTFYHSSQEADSSVFKPRKFDSFTKVQVKAGASFSEERVKLLKLEAEGAEPEILSGFGACLENIEYITADLGFERGVDEESTMVPVLNMLLTHGFRVVDINYQRMVVLFQNKSFL